MKFEEPKIEIISLQNVDVICTSGNEATQCVSIPVFDAILGEGD